MKLVWSPVARAQLLESFAYIAERDVGAAAQVFERITKRAESLMDFPELGPVGRLPDTRELRITGTRYVLVYRVRWEAIEILAVWHGRQSRK